MKNRSFIERAGFAVAGWRAAWLRERSFRTQTIAALAATAILLALRPAPIWWAIVALTGALVLALELINSAIETAIDRLHPAIHPEIKVAKDMLTGAVLLVSLAALIVAICLMVGEGAARLHDWGLIG